MRKNSIKNTRINGEVQKELSSIIRGEIKEGIYQCAGQSGSKGGYDQGTEQCGRIYPPPACQKPEPSKYTGDSFYSGRIDRIWCKYVKTD